MHHFGERNRVLMAISASMFDCRSIAREVTAVSLVSIELAGFVCAIGRQVKPAAH
jgi:hypothetical protein